MLPVGLRKRQMTCHSSTRGLAACLNWIVFAPLSSLGKHQPSGFQGADRLIRGDGLPCAWTRYPLGCRVNTAFYVDGHDGHSDHVSSRSRKWELEGSCYQAPSFLSTLSQTQTMCVLTLRTSTYSRPGWPVGKCCGRLNNMWSQETFGPSLLPLLFESLLCITPLGSLGESGKWFLSVSGLQRHSPPPRSFHSRLGTRWMWLGKYSSLSPGPKVISWYSSCHWLTRSRLRKMA